MSSLVVFSINVQRLALFYQAVLGAESRQESSGDVRIINERDEVLIHAIPREVAASVRVTSPPAPREDSPLKPVFDVLSLDQALRSVEGTGGVDTGWGFTFDGLTGRDVIDPDGNVIQLRSPS